MDDCTPPSDSDGGLQSPGGGRLQVEGGVVDTPAHTDSLPVSHALQKVFRDPKQRFLHVSLEIEAADTPGVPHVRHLLCLLTCHMCQLVKTTLVSTHADPGSDLSCEHVGWGVR